MRYGSKNAIANPKCLLSDNTMTILREENLHHKPPPLLKYFIYKQSLINMLLSFSDDCI
ncbi:MAG: hypothetical protein HC903_13630 [Methylacidiphilales bacterium]|nr:hypothetical protein [Candidatus Methylacidiphilales bacterium]NJR18601.1 hypothetical protein [Calothrix sp. CSU_2_0]